MPDAQTTQKPSRWQDLRFETVAALSRLALVALVAGFHWATSKYSVEVPEWVLALLYAGALFVHAPRRLFAIASTATPFFFGVALQQRYGSTLAACPFCVLTFVQSLNQGVEMKQIGRKFKEMLSSVYWNPCTRARLGRVQLIVRAETLLGVPTSLSIRRLLERSKERRA